MRFGSVLAMAGLAVSLLSGVALAQFQGLPVPDEFTTPEGVTLLTEEEIRAKIIGNTLEGKEYGKRWWELYLPDGNIAGLWATERYGGKWTLSGPVMCYDYKGSGYDGCWTMSLEGDKIDYYKMDGEPDGDAKLREGNPKALF